MYKKAILLSLLLLLYLFMPNNVLAVKVSISPTQAYNGDTVGVPVNMDHAEELAGYQLTVTYDSTVLAYAGYADGAVTPGWMVSVNDVSGQVTIAAYNPNLVNFAGISGSILNLQFNVTGNMGDGSNITITAMRLSDIYGQEIFLTDDTGKRSDVTSILPGTFHTIIIDNDGDGIADDVDNLPGIYNPDQTDTDGDGIPDDIDRCWTDPPVQTDFPVRIYKGGAYDYYSSLQQAYDAAQSGETIMVQAETFIENLNATPASAKTIVIDGGYNCDYSGYETNPEIFTTVKGEVNSNLNSELTMKNLSIEEYSPVFNISTALDCRDDLSGLGLNDYDQDGKFDVCDECPDNSDPNCDPATVDSDGDGMTDAYEIQYGLNRSDANDANMDYDGDGLTNLREFELGTDPQDSDSDDDGVSDGDEYCANLSDLDGDGYWDPGDFDSTCIVDNCPYIPNDQTDSDGDGVGDECDNCTLPNSDQLDADNDGIGDICDTCTDTDLDSFGDPGYSNTSCSDDNCPDTYNYDQTETDGDDIGDACDVCPTVFPIRIDKGGSYDYFTSIQEAYDDPQTQSGDTIEVQADIFYENFVADRNISVTLEGGYDCSFGTYVTDTIMVGELTNTMNSELTVKNFSFRIDCDNNDCDTLPIDDIDSDDDGLIDALDPCPGDPDLQCDRDSDGDGILDSYEIEHGLNRYDPSDAGLDKDKDGYTNLQEYLMGLDADNPDTDHDGIPDGPDNCPVLWTDNQMSSGITIIKAAHFIELRNIISYLRLINGLGPATWNYPMPVPNSSVIYAEDITDLRVALEGVLNQKGIQVPQWKTDPNNVKGDVIDADHINQLRQKVGEACN